MKTGKILTTYTITDGGKFIKKDEDIDEKIFDEIGKKIVFPKLPFTGRR